MDFAVHTIERDIGRDKINAVAGGETAGIPFAAWVADRMHLPMQYVRKKPKGFGRGAQIEGLLVPGQRVLLVWGREDRLVPAVYTDEFTQRLPGARVQIIEGAGHAPHLEQTAVVLGALRGFLA